MTHGKKRVVITGMGAISPIGVSLGKIEESLRNSRSGVGEISLFDTAALPVRFAGQAKDFTPEEHLNPKEIRRNDRFIQMCLAASDLAVKDSGIDAEKLKKGGVAMGVGLGGLYSIEEGTLELQKSGPRKVSPFFVPSILANLASGQVSIRYSMRGPNYAISSACASGSQALGQAFHDIQAGRRDVWLAGGAEAPITPLSISGFASARALSKKNETPVEASRPFDDARDGFVLGEGAATLVLESLESAQKRGAKIYAEILGFGIASDGYHVTEPDPRGEGAFLAMEDALRDSGLDAGKIEYANAHATGTPLGDQIEMLAMTRIFGNHAAKVFVSSTKSLTGHACGAAGSLEAVFCVLMLERKFIAPAFNLPNPSEGFVFRSPTAEQANVQIKTLMNNSFGFGGINTSMILSRFE